MASAALLALPLGASARAPGNAVDATASSQDTSPAEPAPADRTDAAIDPDAPVPRVTSPSAPSVPPIRWVIGAEPAAPPPTTQVVVESVPVPADDTVGAETIEIIDTAPAGAHAEVDEEALERAELDDIHKVLSQVPGVYVRDEDGYGLRPNIGMRGAAAERSAKVVLMEDGVLVAPAPYSAPAAYYFPLVTRMSKVEVVKGPSAIVYGPNTVGGAINMIGHEVPGERAAYLDVALGSDLYGKVHGRAAEAGERWGVMAEYVKLRTDGFKELDGGGDTGFDKNDLQLSAKVASAPSARVYHRVDARVGYATEASDETYTGLTDADFAAAPQRRYAATQGDHMDWDHWRFRLDHRLELGRSLTVETTAYRHQFDRAWGKVDALVGQRDLAGVLANPAMGANPIFYAVLTGAADSSSPEDELIRGTNDRQFLSQGVQSRAKITAELGPTAHQIDAGVRVHFDRAERARYEDAFRMMSGALVPSTRERQTVLDSTAETLAVAVHAQDEVRWKRLRVAAGTRVELIDTSFEDHRAAMPTPAGTRYAVVIPGGGVQLDVIDPLTVLAGVHRGFVPDAPSATAGDRPESSLNYEAGARWRSARVQADLIGFFSDYSNIKGACTFSTGCRAEQEGDQFDGGRAHIWGLEAQASTRVALPAGLHVPLQAVYTLTQSEFRSSFSADFAGWGDVMTGDEMPYLPAHQGAIAVGIGDARWDVGTNVAWRSALRDQAGQGDIPDAERIDALMVIDLNAHLRLGVWGELYGTCNNVLDEQAIVSRRPYGARPNPPRLFTLGYKARF